MIFKKFITIEIQVNVCQNSQHASIYHVSFQVLVIIIYVCVCVITFSFEYLVIQFAYYLENEPKQITYGSTFLGLVIIIMPNFLQFTFPKHWKLRKLQLVNPKILET